MDRLGAGRVHPVHQVGAGIPQGEGHPGGVRFERRDERLFIQDRHDVVHHERSIGQLPNPLD
jgi:hypothetical protein